MIQLNYRIYGNLPINVVVETGLGSSIAEWAPIARKMQNDYGILLYERAGIGKSEPSSAERTPENIAMELHELLSQLETQKQIILLGHSQGGLYAMQFAFMYPDMVKGIILLDPLSPRDLEFREKLTAKEYQKAGVDKSSNFKLMGTLAKLKLGGISKQMLKKAPPIYYFDDYSKEEIEGILSVATNAIFARTAYDEYTLSHKRENLITLSQKEAFPDVPLFLITHSSELAIDEYMKFGGNTREFTERIEVMWQEIMKDYLTYSNQAVWIQAKESTHYIHLQQPELILKTLEQLVKSDK